MAGGMEKQTQRAKIKKQAPNLGSIAFRNTNGKILIVFFLWFSWKGVWGETILWPPKNGFPQAIFFVLGIAAKRRKGKALVHRGAMLEGAAFGCRRPSPRRAHIRGSRAEPVYKCAIRFFFVSPIHSFLLLRQGCTFPDLIFLVLPSTA